MGKAAKFVVRLTIGERVILHGVVDGKRTAKQKSRRAGLLWKAEIKLGSRGKPCLDQRLPNLETRTTEVAAGNARRSEQQVRVN